MRKTEFGTTGDGRETYLFTLENSNGMKAAVTNYGANLVQLLVPDRDGVTEDVVLGFEDVSGYESNPSYFGAVIAPNANRIGGAFFTLHNKEYTLKKNNGENNLHSDEAIGAHKRIWDYETEGESVSFTLFLADGDMGFPGNKKLKVTYTLKDDNGLYIRYEGSSDKDTIINPTNHSYFNLKGHKEGNIMDHIIALEASRYTPADAASIPTGAVKLVEGTPMDLRGGVVIGDQIDADFEQLKFADGYDHNWIPDHCTGVVRRICTLRAPGDKRVMEVYTDLPGVQFYAGNHIKEQTGKEGARYFARSGLCLETQYYPDAIHKDNFPSVIFGPVRPYQSTTIYKFI